MDTYGKTPSVWLDTVLGTDYPPLADEISVDVVIIGAGITGITAATWLKEAGRTVAVIEMAQVGGGVTGRTTAHITEMVDGRYKKIIQNFGEADARLVAQSSRHAIELIAEMIKRRGIDCDFQRVDGYLYTEDARKVGDIKQEADAAQSLGITCELTDEIPLPFTIQRALRVHNQAQFHPLKYLYALAQTIPGDGSYLFEQTHVQQFEDGTPCRILTDKGTITAQDVILATHTPIGLNLSLQTRVAPYRSYVIGAHLVNEPLPIGLFWDTENPYNYIRGYGDLLIIGGRDHKTGQDDDAEGRYAELELYAQERFKLRDIPYRWSAQVYEPADNLPYIGRNPGNEHIYVATGYGGNGMTYGTIAARLLTDILLGRENPWVDVYNPARLKPLASVGDFIRENVNVAGHFLLDRFSPPDVESLVNVPAGQGQIVEFEGQKIAAYRNADGDIYLLAPECTHMGCLVQWNNAESSWDCPCHGGRYSATGQVIEGPPTKNLEMKPIGQKNYM